ncbi:MAG: ion transporter [Candidatus Latescibacteria bacterium]|nr:ion transporter [Candidatus Latescibacterota bacterium]
MTERLGRLVDSNDFQYGILAVIMLAALLVGLETSKEIMARHGALLHGLDALVLWVFVGEAALKMARHGGRWYRYFGDPWNVFDFLIVVVCFLPIGGQYAAVLRLARVLRAMRLVTVVPRLQLLVGSLLKSIPSLVYVGLLLGVLFYIYAVMGVFMFRGNDPVHFNNLSTALLTLFRVVTLEDWTDVMYIQMYGSAAYPGYADYALAHLREASRGLPLVGAAYFVSFVMFGTMIMLNLFIGVIINSMDEAQAENEAEERRKNLEQDGQISVGDEIRLIEEEVGKLSRRLGQLHKRADGKDGA